MSDQQGQRVLQCLAASLDHGNPAAIRAAEAQLALEAQQPGFGVVLSRIALAAGQGIAADQRQLAAVLLKQYVKQHWQRGERGFTPPEASEEDKADIRAALPAGLSDPDSKVRTAVGMAVAAIASWDWPQAWPGLLEFVVTSIKDRRQETLVMGCVRCLSVMAADLDNEQAPQLVQVLSPGLASIVSAPGTPSGIVARCFSIMADLASALAALSGTYQRQVRSMLVPLMQPWVPLVCGVLGADVQDQAMWPAKMAALRLAQPLVTYFSKPLESSMPELMGATWQLLLAAQPLHQAVLVEGLEQEEPQLAAEGEDEDGGLEGLLAQLFELLLSFVGPSRFRAQLEGALPQMLYVSVSYMQMTRDQALAWAASPNQFIADEEEDMMSCRASAELLLCELADEFGAAALAALLEAVAKRLGEADAAAAAGRGSWWLLREAAVSCLGAVWEQIVSAVHARLLPAQHVQELADSLLQRDLRPLLQQQQQGGLPGDEGAQFLAGRVLSVGAKLHEVLTPPQREALLKAAAAAVAANPSAVVTVSAFRALAVLCPAAAPEQLRPLLQPLLAALVKLLGAAEEESLHLVLEVLEATIRACRPRRGAPGAAGGGDGGGEALQPEQAMAVAGPVLQAWIAHTSDPLIGPDAQEVVAALAEHPNCLPSLAAAVAPTLSGILERGAAARLATRQGLQPPPLPQQQQQGAEQESPMLVEATLDLLGTLVQPSQPAVAVELCRVILGPLLGIARSSDDASELASAVNLLLSLLRSCPTADVLACPAGAGAEGGVLALLLVAVRELLAPGRADGCARVAGPLAVQLLKTFAQQLGAPPPPAVLSAGGGAVAAGSSCVALLLHDAAARLGSGACSPAAAMSLLEVVVRLALVDVQQLVDLLAGVQVQRRDGPPISGLAAVLPLWLELGPDMPGGLLARQNAAALLALLQLRHSPALGGLMVPGRPIEAPGGGEGRVTRSRAKQQGGLQFTQVPAPAKVLQVLGQLLAADAEAGASRRPGGRGGWPGEEEEEDSEEYETEEGDDNEGAEAGGAASQAAELAGITLQGVRAGLPPQLATEGLDGLFDVEDRSAAATPLPDDPADASDPLLRTPVRALLRQGLAALAAADRPFLEAAGAHIGPGRELTALQELLGGSEAGGQ